MTWGETIASRRVASSRLAIWLRLRSSWPEWVPAPPLADRRVKWTETPVGASSVISGSTVGLPGGARNPIRVLHPIMTGHLRCAFILPLAWGFAIVGVQAPGLAGSAAFL